MIRAVLRYDENTGSYCNRLGRPVLCFLWAVHIYGFHETRFLYDEVGPIELRISKRWHSGAVLFGRRSSGEVENLMNPAFNPSLASHVRAPAYPFSYTYDIAQKLLDRVPAHPGDRFWVSVQIAKKGKKRKVEQ